MGIIVIDAHRRKLGVDVIAGPVSSDGSLEYVNDDNLEGAICVPEDGII